MDNAYTHSALLESVGCHSGDLGNGQPSPQEGEDCARRPCNFMGQILVARRNEAGHAPVAEEGRTMPFSIDAPRMGTRERSVSTSH